MCTCKDIIKGRTGHHVLGCTKLDYRISDHILYILYIATEPTHTHTHTHSLPFARAIWTNLRIHTNDYPLFCFSRATLISSSMNRHPLLGEHTPTRGYPAAWCQHEVWQGGGWLWQGGGWLWQGGEGGFESLRTDQKWDHSGTLYPGGSYVLDNYMYGRSYVFDNYMYSTRNVPLSF